jgi:hypothetical protein
MQVLEHFDATRWDGPFGADDQARAVDALERGRLLYFLQLAFPLEPEERRFLSPTWSDGRAKNISFDPRQGSLKGTMVKGTDARALPAMMARYASATRQVLVSMLPQYGPHLLQARTSFRPLEIAGRPSSYKKDDTRLHTDAFPSRPTRGARILRVFTSVNPSGQDRVWRVGEPFEAFARQFLPFVSGPVPGLNWLLAALRITKGRRSAYDHLMLQLHDRVKADERYQREVPQVELAFPPGSTWVVFTDQVLHAAMSGQYLFEQTFHMPVSAQHWPERSPLKTLERLSGRTLTA